MNRKTIVISAVNLVVGGTLTILRDCLEYLSKLSETGNYRIIALVFDKNLALYPNIEYIELQWPKKKWVNRLWCEYVSMKKIADEIGPVYLWLSLHDTTPNVVAEHRAVYCHNPFPFYTWSWRELWFNYKIVLFSWFSYFIYKINIHKNRFVIVQQQWIKDAFMQMYSLPSEKVIVSVPNKKEDNTSPQYIESDDRFSFIFASSANSHKNFECLCEAAKLLENEIGVDKFRVIITINGTENKYAQWLYSRWGAVSSIEFAGFMDRKTLFGYYQMVDCMVFPSKVETWGLPISEFGLFDKPMLLANELYAHETASGLDKVAFFKTDEPKDLAEKMKKVMAGDKQILSTVEKVHISVPKCYSWQSMFDLLLKDKEE